MLILLASDVSCALEFHLLNVYSLPGDFYCASTFPSRSFLGYMRKSLTSAILTGVSTVKTPSPQDIGWIRAISPFSVQFALHGSLTAHVMKSEKIKSRVGAYVR